MRKRFMIVFIIAIALIASAASAAQWTERNAPAAAKERPEKPKDAPGPVGNPLLGNPGIVTRAPLSEDFEGGAIPADWTIHNEDGDLYQWEAYDASSTTIGAHSGSYVARIHYNSSGCDDWLITPRLTVAVGDTLKFWAASYSSSFLEDFEVWVSTTGTAVGDFVNNELSITAQANAWTQYAIDLAAYAGQNIYLAVQCVSVDEFYLYLDDFSGPELWVPAGPAIAFNTTDLKFGTVTLPGSADLPLVIYSVGASDLTVSGVGSDNAHFTHDFPGATAIAPGDSLTVTVTFTPTADPEETGTLTVTHDGTKADSYITMSGSGFSGLMYEDFMSGVPPTGWTNYTLGASSNGWVQATPGYDDDYCAHVDYDYTAFQDNWLVSPAVTLPAKAVYELEFLQYETFMTWYNYHAVYISTGSGVPPTDFVELAEIVPDIDYTWDPVEDISLAAYAGQTVYLAFVYQGVDADEWSIDNAVVQEFIYVNEPPVIVHDPKGDTWDTTPTFTAFINDVESFTASLFYQPAGTKAWTEVAMTSTGVLPDEFSTSFLAYGPLNYYIRAEDDSGLVAVDPPGAPVRFYSFNTFEIQPVVGDQIVYDDGTVENATAWLAGYEANRFAVRFSPPAYPCTLTAVSVGIFTDWPDERHQPFIIEVYDDDGASGTPGTMIYGPDTTGSIGNVVGGLPAGSSAPYPLEWAYVCIHPLVIITEGDFYIAKGQASVNPECEGLDIDDTGTQFSRSWQLSSGVWSEYYPGERNLMIRAYTAQVTTIGQMAGTVTEAVKGPIEGAIVTAVGIDTKSDTTDASGNYFIADLTSGLYDVTATAAGFAPQTQFDVSVPELDTAIVDFALSPYGANDVLVVDADGSAYIEFSDVQAYFTDALTACGYTYDVWEKMTEGEDGPDHTIMEMYDAVVWFTGEAWQNSQTLTATDEAELALYLDGGGYLFLSAQDYLYDRYISAGAFSPGQFPYDYLGVTSVVQDALWMNDPDVGTATGYAGSVADGLSYDLLDVYTTAKEGLPIDELTIAGDAVFSADSGTDHVDIGACQYETVKGFKTVFLTVDFAGLVDGTNTRAELMCSIMDYFFAPPAEMWLSGGGVDPIIGSLATPFTYTVTYTQINDVAPTQQDVVIDGSSYVMTDPTGGAGPYAGGVQFSYLHTFDVGGDHEFHFEFADGTNSDRLPSAGELWGPMNGYYFYDFESGDGGFTATGPADDWEYGLPTAGPGAAHSGDYCWGTVLAGNYLNNSQSRLESPSLDFTLGGGDHLELKFWHFVDSEGSYSPYDGGNVKLILPGSTVIIYPDLALSDDYDTYAMNSSNAWIPDEAAYFGLKSGWKEAIFDLTPWTGESDVKIAFDFGSDGSVAGYDGWYIDDVVIWGYPPLPVELSAFTATAGDRMVTLMWETRSELNNLGFELYRREADGEFEKITAELIPGAGNSETAQTYSYVDRGLDNGTSYSYQLAAVDFGGQVRMHDVLVSATPTASVPTAFALFQNYPNPFNPNTEIKYQLPEGSRVVLKIYNVMGQAVVTLMDKDLKAGYYTATWDARDAGGQQVSAGIYFCTMQAGEFSQTVKMVLLK